MRTIRGPRHERRALRPAMGLGLALAATVLLGVPVAAQQAGPPRGQMDRTQIEQRIMAQFRTLVGTELGIDSVTAGALFTVVGEMQEERRTLQMREFALDRRLRGTGVYLSDQQSAEALDELIAIKREELRLLEAEHGRLGEVLSPPQLLRFYSLRDEMGERIRRLRGGERGPRGGPSGQPFE